MKVGCAELEITAPWWLLIAVYDQSSTKAPSTVVYFVPRFSDSNAPVRWGCRSHSRVHPGMRDVSTIRLFLSRHGGERILTRTYSAIFLRSRSPLRSSITRLQLDTPSARPSPNHACAGKFPCCRLYSLAAERDRSFQLCGHRPTPW
jgi:hypothetical protein